PAGAAGGARDRIARARPPQPVQRPGAPAADHGWLVVAAHGLARAGRGRGPARGRVATRELAGPLRQAGRFGRRDVTARSLRDDALEPAHLPHRVAPDEARERLLRVSQVAVHVEPLLERVRDL